MEGSPQHLQKVQEINSAILTTRNNFIGHYRRGNMGSRLLTYEPGLDRGVYQTLKTFEHIPEESAYIRARNELNAQTAFSVETFIGERLNVGLSQFRYDLRDGKLYGQGMTEPLVDMISRGRDCRDSVAADIDKPRQDAEVEQFEKIEKIFGNPDTKPGTTIISLSPPGQEGSAYSHNFYDVFVLSEDADTDTRFVEARRYASSLCLEEYKERAEQLDSAYFDEYKNGPMDSYYLSHPLLVDTKSPLSGNPDALHASLQQGHEFLSTEDFVQVRRSIAGLVTSYINTLCDTPDDEQFLNITLNAIMNQADHTADALRRSVRVFVGQQKIDVPLGPVSRLDITKLGKQPVRQVATGCGSSSGFDTGKSEASNVSSFGLRDFGTDKLGNRTFDCPECGEMNIRPVNETIPECQHCGSKKVAC
ncbi:MAG TPA: hypothetical protein VLB73_04725 [Patescibacteria group bacterium]|nr:hypothetical protein [Patescibacteria group bacterium]